MGVADDTKKLGGDIVASYDLRVKEIRELAKDTQNMLKGFQGEQKDIQAEQKNRNKEVADLLKEHKTEREKMAANWQALNAAMAKRRGTKPKVEAELKARPVEEVIEETKEDKVVPEIELEEEVLEFIERHPEGVKVGDMEEFLGVQKMRLGKVAKELLEKGKVRKEGKTYFPL